jgi:hypothetical protein
MWGCGLMMCLHASTDYTQITENKTGNVWITQHWGACVQPLWKRKSTEYYTTCVCVFAVLGIQHAMHMRHVIICVLLRSTMFFHIFPSTARFPRGEKSYWTQNVFWFSLKLSSETFFILTGIGRDINVKYPLILSDFNNTWLFPTGFRKIFTYQISRKSV